MLINIYDKLKLLKSQGIGLISFLSIVFPILITLLGSTGYFILTNNGNSNGTKVDVSLSNYCFGEVAKLRVELIGEVDELNVSFLNFSESCYNCKYLEKEILLDTNKIFVLVKYRVGNNTYEYSKEFEILNKSLNFDLTFENSTLKVFGNVTCYDTISFKLLKDNQILDQKDVKGGNLELEFFVNESGNYCVSAENLEKCINITFKENKFLAINVNRQNDVFEVFGEVYKDSELNLNVSFENEIVYSAKFNSSDNKYYHSFEANFSKEGNYVFKVCLEDFCNFTNFYYSFAKPIENKTENIGLLKPEIRIEKIEFPSSINVFQEFEIKVYISSLYGNSSNVSVKLQIPKEFFGENLEKVIDYVEENKTYLVSWIIKANSCGNYTLNVSVKSGNNEDVRSFVVFVKCLEIETKIPYINVSASVENVEKNNTKLVKILMEISILISPLNQILLEHILQKFLQILNMA